MQRQGSFSSQGSGASGYSGDSRVSAVSNADNKKDQDGHQDLLEQQASFAAGIFGVLFTISKEKVDSSKKFAVAKIVLDYIQLLWLVVHPDFGWDIDEDFFLWKVIQALNLKNPIVNQGYNFYLAILYIVAAILVLSLLLCIWVGWCFKNQRFPLIWPIKVLRLFVSVFFQVFYIAALGVFLVAVDCRWFGSGSDTAEFKKYHVQAFQEVECKTMPHLAHMLVAVVLIIVFIIVSLTVTAADFELNPLSRRWLASSSSSVEFRAVLIRTVATLAFALLDDLRKLQGLIIASCMALMCYSFIRWEPHLHQWVNHVRAGLYGSLTYASAMLCALLYRLPQESDSNKTKFAEKMTTAMLAGLAPCWLLAMFISWLRFRYTFNKALKAVKAMEPGQNLREVYRWPNVETVEMVSRVCRKWDPKDDEIVDPDAVKLAETVMKGGMAFFSAQPDMVLLYSSFLIEVTGAYQSGHSQLGSAKSLSPNYTQQFVIFVREQLHMQRSQTQSSGESSVDLVSYVEYQRNYRMLVSFHRSALVATRAFWRLLLRSEISFTALSKAFHVIDDSQTRAEKMYKNVMERYPSSAKVLRLYARFLEEVKGDPWTAAQFYAESEKMEEQQADMTMMTKDGDGISNQVDERNNPVCVINASGIIQMVNKVLSEKWGFKRDELNGKNVSMLMPNPFANKHNTFLRNYLTTGKAKILDTTREVLALHKDRYCFPVKLHVTKVSGEGADSVFMGVFRNFEEDHSLVRAYCSTGGIVLTCDARFVDWFGKSVMECVGRHFGSLTLDAGAVDKLIMRAAEMDEATLASGVLTTNVQIVHKFSDAVECNVTVTMGGTESQRLLVVTIRRKVAADLMFCCDTHGRIVYCTTALAHFLNYEPRELVKTNMCDLLPPPFKSLHQKWMKNPPAKVPLNSCRGNSTVTIVPKGKASVPVRCTINQREVNEQHLFVVILEPSSFEEGLDERRLRLKLDPDKQFQAPVSIVGQPRNVFGQRPTAYVGAHLSNFIDAFRVMREADPTCDANSVQSLVLELIKKAREVPGLSYRCGVHPPVSEDRFAVYRQLTAEVEAHEKAMAKAVEDGLEAPVPRAELRKFMMERQLLTRETRSVRMLVQIKEHEDVPGEEHADTIPEIILELTQAESITAVIELDGKGKIVKSGCCALHMAGIVFGCSNASMVTRSIREYLVMPPGTKPIAFLMADDDNKKKSALKSAHMSKKTGPVKTMEMRHMDGKAASVLVQCVLKEGVLNRYVLRCQVHKPQVNIKDFQNIVQGSGQVRLGNDGDWLGDDDDDDGDVDMGRGAGGGPAQAVTQRQAVKASPKFDDDNEDGDKGLLDLPAFKTAGTGVPKVTSAVNMAEGDNSGRGVKKLAFAEPSKSSAPVGKARRAAFQVDDGNDDGGPRRAGSPPVRKGAVPLSSAGALVAAASAQDRLAGEKAMSEKSSESGMSSEDASTMNTGGKAADAGAGGPTSDYRRGKRYKKLNQMLSSKQNQATLLDFQNHSAVVTAALMLVHVVCFAVVITVVSQQSNLVLEMEHAGHAMDHMHRGTAYIIALDAMHKNQSAVANYYNVQNITAFDKSEINKYAELLEMECNLFEESHQSAYLGYKKLRRVKDLPGIPLRTIWESNIRVSKIFVDTDNTTESTITTTLWHLGNEWTSAAREVMANHELMAAAFNGTIMPHREYYFATSNGPESLYNGYKLLLDAMVDWSIHEVDKITTILLVLMCIEAIGMVAVSAAYLLRLLSRVGAYRFSLFSTFLVVPSSFLRALASKKIVVGDEEEEDDDDDEEQAAAEANKAANAQASGPAAAATMGHKISASTSRRPSAPTSDKPPKTGLLTTLRDMFGSSKSNQLSMHGKRLVKSPFDSMELLLPLAAYAALVIIIYVVSYVDLSKLDAPTTMINVLAFIQFRVSRAVFFAVQVCSQTDNSTKQYWQQLFVERLAEMALEWNVMVLGPHDAAGVHFARAESVLWRGMEHQNIVFRARDRCFRAPDKGACYTPDHYFYEVSQNGMGYMMRRLIEEFSLLSKDSVNDIHMNNKRLVYIWEVGLNDLTDAVRAEYEQYRTITESVLSNVITLHIVLLVLSLLLSLFFLVFIVRPFMKRSQKESRRVAELLSQLPADLDVEGMVQTVLQQAAWRARGKVELQVATAAAARRLSSGSGSLGGDGEDEVDPKAYDKKVSNDDASSMASSH